MNRKQKKVLIRIIIAAVFMVVLHFLPLDGVMDGWLRFFLYLIPYLVVGYDILIKAWKGIRNRQPFDENFLMAVASIGAIVLGRVRTGDYAEGAAVMLFYQIGELFQSVAVGRSRRNISSLSAVRVTGNTRTPPLQLLLAAKMPPLLGVLLATPVHRPVALAALEYL